MSNSATPRTVPLQAPLCPWILQARILEWLAIPFSKGSSEPRDQTQFSHIAGRFFTIWATREAHKIYSLYFFINLYFINKNEVIELLLKNLLALYKL